MINQILDIIVMLTITIMCIQYLIGYIAEGADNIFYHIINIFTPIIIFLSIFIEANIFVFGIQLIFLTIYTINFSRNETCVGTARTIKIILMCLSLASITILITKIYKLFKL